jgi:hypothetical protein
MWNLPTTERNLLMTQIPTTIMHINNNIKTFQENPHSIITINTFHPQVKTTSTPAKPPNNSNN